jgi:hypothetical protein
VLSTLESGISESRLYDGMRKVTYKDNCSLIDFTITIISVLFDTRRKRFFFRSRRTRKYCHESRMIPTTHDGSSGICCF